jgi:hypothetical protein
MFKIFSLDSDAAQTLDTLQGEYEILDVGVIGKDSQFNPYLLVQYDTKPDAPMSGSVVVDDPGTSGSLGSGSFDSGSFDSGSFDPSEDLKSKKVK